MRDAFPVIRLQGRGGWIAGRDGVVISFFFHEHPEAFAHAIWRALQIYLQAIPPGSLGWYPSEEGELDPLDAQGWERIRKYLLDPPWKGVWSIELMESPSEAGSYHFEYYARRLGDPIFKDPISSVSFTFPTEYLLEHGASHLRALALELGRELPFNFGYASFAIVSPQGLFSSGDWTLIEALLARYPGLDAYNNSRLNAVIGTHALPPAWLTFLGQPLLTQLGGIDALRNALPFPEVSLLPMDGDRVLVTLDEWPDPIDTQAKAIPPQYRALARLMEPTLFQYDGEELLPFQHDTNRWLRRFL
ncbi:MULTISPECIES: DUF3396 domain-containing protein [unclassified Corallococcus]|uniref:DUF3396 domain-containing protein n=1 Tax=unclassified Corallococcus TaxID=2685029 RepID=UPI001A8E3386|nr:MULTISPECIES: DUF3396 domain-containing protein [unclassified Corallococcus]MBN9682182.1 DUF3396 domain-containing protein [Corallococcus sp. NCSPR001]WAS86256.1 DUF3396 domain-containing protein [Corallococcus sp. NCRR]